MSIDPLGQNPNSELAVSDFASKKIIAGICGILLNSFAAHKFILGQRSPASSCCS